MTQKGPKPEHRSRVRAQHQPGSTRTRLGLFLEVFQQGLVGAALRRKTSGEASGPAAAPPPSASEPLAVRQQTNGLRSQLRRFPLKTGNTGAPAPGAKPVANKAGGSGGAPAGNDELGYASVSAASCGPAQSSRRERTLSKPFQNKAEMT
ncbi:hypothetical protein ACER0C_019889 [Sarotherodon galilaeus]